MTRTFGVAGLVVVVLLSLLAAPAAAQPNVAGQWSSVPALPFFPVHMHLLPNGKVMLWPGDAGISGNDPRLWDPDELADADDAGAAGQAGVRPVLRRALLPCRRTIVRGRRSHPEQRRPEEGQLYDPVLDKWSNAPEVPDVPDMNAGRWYPTVTTLANGDALVVSGSIDTTVGTNTLPQVYQAATGTWRSLTNAQLLQDLYPFMFLAPNGKVALVGPARTSRYLDTSGTGAWTTITRKDDVWRDYGSAVMYEPGKILVVGGGNPPTATAQTFDLNEATPTWRNTASMSIARRQLNATLLPDGTVLVSGGTYGAGTNNTATPVFHAESWNPATGTWTQLASASVPRLYHSSALLLPDGRVLVTGGNNYRSAEVFSPPYLFKGARPTMSRRALGHRLRPALLGADRRCGEHQQGDADPARLGDARVRHEPAPGHLELHAHRDRALHHAAGQRQPGTARALHAVHREEWRAFGRQIVHLTPGPGGTTPTVSIDDVTVTEGNTGSVSAIFTVSLSAAEQPSGDRALRHRQRHRHRRQRLHRHVAAR